MTARLIDGTAVARGIYSAVSERVKTLMERGVRPGLAAVQYGENAASQVYLRNKVRACTEAGMHSEVHRLPADCSERDALEIVERLNADPAIHGILVQLPLPPHLDTERVTQAILPSKDVDG